MWIIIAAIIIFIIFADSDTKPSANKKGNTNTDSRLTLHRQPNRILQLNLKSDWNRLYSLLPNAVPG